MAFFSWRKHLIISLLAAFQRESSQTLLRAVASHSCRQSLFNKKPRGASGGQQVQNAILVGRSVQSLSNTLPSWLQTKQMELVQRFSGNILPADLDLFLLIWNLVNLFSYLGPTSTCIFHLIQPHFIQGSPFHVISFGCKPTGSAELCFPLDSYS